MSGPAADLQWIIPCCSRKQNDENLLRDGVVPSNKDWFTKLEPYRTSLIRSLVSSFNSWECGPNSPRSRAKEDNCHLQTGRFFSALDRYNGNLYQELTQTAIQSILNRDERFEFLILSALYGLLRPEDGIAYYNLMMGDRCNDSRVVEKFELIKTKAKVDALWKSIGSGILGQSLQPTARVYCLLSGTKYMGYQGVVYAWRQALGLKGYRIVVENGNSAVTPPTHGRFLNYCLVNEVTSHTDILNVAMKFNCRVEKLW